VITGDNIVAFLDGRIVSGNTSAEEQSWLPGGPRNDGDECVRYPDGKGKWDTAQHLF
jgi:hypothetical protein